jgi:hypothetical protein
MTFFRTARTAYMRSLLYTEAHGRIHGPLVQQISLEVVTFEITFQTTF